MESLSPWRDNQILGVSALVINIPKKVEVKV